MPAPIPSDERERLRTLRRYALLDTAPEPDFERVVRLASRLLDMPISTVTLVDEDRQWFKARVGMESQEGPRDLSICAHAIAEDDPLIVRDLRDDPRFSPFPVVSAPQGIRFYAGVPLRGDDDSHVGVLCVMDRTPRELDADQRQLLLDLADIAMDALRLHLAKLENDRLSLIVQNVGVGVIVTDPSEPDNPIIYSNHAFCRISGYERAEFIGRNCRFLQGPGSDPAVVSAIRRSIAERVPFRGIIRNYRKDGSEFVNDLTITPVLDAVGRLLNFVAIQHDVTDRAVAEERLRESYQQLRVLEGQRDSLTSMVVHDMRSPLTVAISFLDLLRMEAEGRLTREDEESIEYATSALTELNEMVTSLLDVSRLESGEMPLDIREHDLGALVHDTLASRVAAEGAERLCVKVIAGPVLARCDAGVTGRVITNLVGNALKFTPADGSVQVRVEAHGSGGRVSVQDTGPGIAPGDHQRIFEKFGQVGHTRSVHSTGLGLAFCRLAVDAQRGVIGLESEPGMGSTFWFTLP